MCDKIMVIELTKNTENAATENDPATPDEKIEAVPSPIFQVFGKYNPLEVVVDDPGLAKYINLTPVGLPHTGGRNAKRVFMKANMSIVERFLNSIMRTENYTGKKEKAHKAVEKAFELIEKRTKHNPIQVLVSALENAAPMEEATRLRFGGISVPKAVDIAPSRRLDMALRNIARGAVNATFKNKRPFTQCLANEIIAAANNDVNCFSISKKEEKERVAGSAR